MTRPLALVSALIGLGACATTPEKLDSVAIAPAAQADKWEKFNRKSYAFSNKADKVVLVPVTKAYRTIFPNESRRAIGNFFDNARAPQHMANAILQGKGKSAFRALDRILVNGVLGLAVADHATEMGLPAEPHDFGQTLAVWGVSSGPYVYVPFAGPNTLRDGAGFLVDFVFDPIDLVRNRLLSREERYISLGYRIVDIRSGVMDQGEQLLQGAADPYATMRAAYLQLRRYELHDGVLPVSDEDYGDDSYDALPPLEDTGADDTDASVTNPETSPTDTNAEAASSLEPIAPTPDQPTDAAGSPLPEPEI